MKSSTASFLKKNNMILYKKIMDSRSSIFLIENNTTYLVRDHETIQLESKDSMVNQKFLYNQYEFKNYNRLVFIGVVSYQSIVAAITKSNNVRFDLVFISFDEALHFFHNNDLSKKYFRYLNRIYIIGESDVNDIANSIISTISEQTVFLEHAILKYYFPNIYNDFNEALKNALKRKKNMLSTNVAYEQKWILNSLVNFSKVLRTKSIFDYKKDVFLNKDIIIVAAGPSLEFEFENLRKIIRDGSAFVVAAGSAINALLSNDIKPHAMLTYDPSHLNIKVYEKLINEEITDIPLIFGSTTAEDVIRIFKGPKVHYITAQDKLSAHLVGDNRIKDEVIHDAPVITILAIDLFNKLNAKRLILVGQNFAFYNRQWYSKGIDYDHFKFDESTRKNILEVESVDGITITTDEALLRSKISMEQFINNNGLTNIINTTKHGAFINGTKYIELSDVMKTLRSESFTYHWMDGIVSSGYNYNDLDQRIRDFYDSYKIFKDILELFRDHTISLTSAIESSIDKKIILEYTKFENLLIKIEGNDFFKVIINPMNRVRREILVNKATEAKRYTNIVDRVKYMSDAYEGFTASLISLLKQYGILLDLFFIETQRIIAEKQMEM